MKAIGKNHAFAERTGRILLKQGMILFKKSSFHEFYQVVCLNEDLYLFSLCDGNRWSDEPIETLPSEGWDVVPGGTKIEIVVE